MSSSSLCCVFIVIYVVHAELPPLIQNFQKKSDTYEPSPKKSHLISSYIL